MLAGSPLGIGWGGSTSPTSSGAVEVAPEALCPARAGPSSSGGSARRGPSRKRSPAAERSRPAPPAAGRGEGEGESPGPSPQNSVPAPGTRVRSFLRELDVALLP